MAYSETVSSQIIHRAETPTAEAVLTAVALNARENKMGKLIRLISWLKDLNGIEHLPFFKCRYRLIKIEGGLKGNLYAATPKSYSKQLMSGTIRRFQREDSTFTNELEKMSHREYTDASLISPAGAIT